MIQIWGTRKCNDTKKALRFFKERNITYQFIDLTQKAMSPGELRAVAKVLNLGALLNREGREFDRLNLRGISFSIEQVLLEHPLTLKTPIVRNGARAMLGYEPEILRSWLIQEVKK